MFHVSTDRRIVDDHEPELPATVLVRARFAQLLESQAQPDLITVWATAGAGKTTLLSSWAAQLRARGERVTWVAMAAARTDDQTVESLVSRAIDDGGSAAVHTVFIDDAHLAVGHRDRQWLSELGRNPQSALRAVIAGRYQPVPLPRAMLGRRLVELRSGDLAFTELEASSYFRSRGIHLRLDQLQLVLEHTGGWAVALALMADRLGTAGNMDEFIRDFSGDHGSVADYLVTEILSHQPDPRKRFLLQTSVVDELTVPLAVHLTGRTNAGELLDELEEENTLIRRGGGDSPVFQYHTLLRSHLQAHLLRHDYTEAVELNRSASGWFLAHGRADLALRHTLLTDDSDDVASILDDFGMSLIFAGKATLVRSALRFMDAARVGSATCHLLRGLLSAPHFVNEVATQHDLAVVQERQESLSPHLRVIFHALVVMRARGARNIASAEESLDASERALEAAGWNPKLDDAVLDAKIFAEAARGFARLARGDGAAASDLLRSDAQNAPVDTRPWLSLFILDLAATASASVGRWQEMTAIESQMAASTQCDGPAKDPVVSLARYTVAVAAYARCTVMPPEQLASLIGPGPGADADEGLGAGWAASSRVLAELFAIDGNPNPRGSYDRLDRALQGAASLQPRTLANSAFRYSELTMRFHGRQRGRDVLRVVGTTLGSDSVDYRLCSALLHSGTTQANAEESELEVALLNQSRVWCPSNLVLGWLLLSRAAESAGRLAAADERVYRALDLAEQMEARRPFMASSGLGSRLIETRVGRLGPHEAFAQSVLLAHARMFRSSHQHEPDIASLTRKEHDILRELPHHQSISEIARKQQLSANTVKTHLRSIYQKFGVSGRAEAVEHAVQTGLI